MPITRPPYSLAYAVLGLSLAATLGVTGYVWSSAERSDRARFESQAVQAEAALRNRLHTYVDMLISGAALFAASDHVARSEFARFVDALRLQDRHPGVQGVGYSVRLPVASADSLAAAQRRSGFPDFRLWPPPTGEYLHSIVYLRPQDPRNRAAIGYDMFSDSVRRRAMERARDTGRPAASGIVTLVQEIDEDVQPGFLIYVPVYRGGDVPTDVQARRERLLGFVYSPFRVHDLMRGTLTGDAPVELRVYDGLEPVEGRLLFDSRAVGRRFREPRFAHTVAVDVAGRSWTAVLGSTPSFEASSTRGLAPIALVLGLLISGALFGLVRSEGRARWRAEGASRALRESETQYRTTFEANPHPMWVYDRDTMRFLAVNDAAVSHYGYPRERFLQMDVRDIRPPEDVPALEQRIATSGDADHDAGIWRHTKADGSIIRVRVTSRGLPFAGRRARLVLAHDVTGELRSQERLKQAQRRIEQILSLSSAIIYTLDVGEEGLSVTWVSDNLERITGYTTAEGLDPTWWSGVVHPDDLRKVRAAEPRLFGEGRRSMEYRMRHAEGHYIWVRDDAVLRRDEAARPVEVIGSWLDVTERKRLEGQFQQAQKMEAVGRLAGGIAHDFNNLLTVIRSQTDLLLMDLEPGPVSEGVELIQSSADRAARLTEQLLAFSREQVLRPRVVDPREAVAAMVRLLERVLGEDVTLVREVPADLPPIEVDPGQLEQALLNLAVNARDAMQGGGRLTFSAAPTIVDEELAARLGGAEPGSYVALHVTDTGAGMDEETLGRVFEPFFTTKPRGRGTGLGLPMVYGFMKQSRGGVLVESEPDEGTTVSLLFPASEGVPEPTAPAPSRHSDTSPVPGTVLLVEDDDSVRAVARRILERGGLDVHDVASAEEALESLAGGLEADALLTDLVLPSLSGRELVRRLRASAPGLPMVVMSGYDEAAPGMAASLPDDVAFLRKPFTPDELLRSVRAAVRGR